MTERPDKPLPMPVEGGSYIRNADGSLTRVSDVSDEPPQAPPVEAPAKAPKRPAKEG